MKQKGRPTSLYHQGKRNRQELERRRIEAAKLFQEGKTTREVAEIYRVSYEAARLWCHTFKKKGIKGLKSKGKPGPKPKLTEIKKEKVRQALLKGPQAFGYKTNIWTLARITNLIKKIAKVSYHPGHVWYILRDMGWSCQRPRTQSKNRNERIINKWIKISWPAIKKRGKN